jgi:transposase
MHTYFSVPVFVKAFFFCAAEMERGVLTEQRTNIKFLVQLGKSRREILEMLETVCGESAIKRRTVYKWVDQFKEWWESVNANAHYGRPSMSRVGENIQRVHNLVISDRRIITTIIITDKLGISKGSVQTI